MRKFFFTAIIVGILAAVRFYYQHHYPLEVKVTQAKPGPAVQAIYATGTVESEIMLPLSFRSTARLTKLLVDEGAEVKEGELLAELENEDVLANINELKARESFARADYERNAKLFKQKEVPEQILERSKSEWAALQASRERLEQQSDYLKLRAPRAGRIIRRDGEIGELIPTAQPILWLSASENIRLTAEVDEENIPLIKVGMKALVRTDAFPSQHFNAKVQSITPKGDYNSRSYRVRLAFTESVPLQIGMTAEVNIVAQEKSEALLLPTTAIDGNNVYVLKGRSLSKQAVSIGIRGLEKTEILSGVEPEDLVVTLPAEVKDIKRPLKAVLEGSDS